MPGHLLWVLVRNGLSHTFKHLQSQVFRQKEKYYNSKAKGGEKKEKKCLLPVNSPYCTVQHFQIVAYANESQHFSSVGVLTEPKLHPLLILFPAFTAHAAADSALPGFLFCALSGQRIPQRNGGIVDADLPKKSHKKELN